MDTSTTQRSGIRIKTMTNPSLTALLIICPQRHNLLTKYVNPIFLSHLFFVFLFSKQKYFFKKNCHIKTLFQKKKKKNPVKVIFK